MSESFRIRFATSQDADAIAWHRARMFQDMGDVSVDAFETLRKKARACIEEWLERGAYVGWLASPADKPKIIIAGAGAFRWNRSSHAHRGRLRLAKAGKARLSTCSPNRNGDGAALPVCLSKK